MLSIYEQNLQNEVVSHEDGFPTLEVEFGMIEPVQGRTCRQYGLFFGMPSGGWKLFHEK